MSAAAAAAARRYAHRAHARVADNAQCSRTHGPEAGDRDGQENAGDVDDVAWRAAARVVAEHACGAHAGDMANWNLRRDFLETDVLKFYELGAARLWG